MCCGVKQCVAVSRAPTHHHQCVVVCGCVWWGVVWWGVVGCGVVWCADLTSVPMQTSVLTQTFRSCVATIWSSRKRHHHHHHQHHHLHHHHLVVQKTSLTHLASTRFCIRFSFAFASPIFVLEKKVGQSKKVGKGRTQYEKVGNM